MEQWHLENTVFPVVRPPVAEIGRQGNSGVREKASGIGQVCHKNFFPRRGRPAENVRGKRRKQRIIIAAMRLMPGGKIFPLLPGPALAPGTRDLHEKDIASVMVGHKGKPGCFVEPVGIKRYPGHTVIPPVKRDRLHRVLIIKRRNIKIVLEDDHRAEIGRHARAGKHVIFEPQVLFAHDYFFFTRLPVKITRDSHGLFIARAPVNAYDEPGLSGVPRAGKRTQQARKRIRAIVGDNDYGNVHA